MFHNEKPAYNVLNDLFWGGFMDSELIKKYTDEMFKMRARAVPAAAMNIARPDAERSNGGVTVRVTTLRGLYPVEGATVTVYSGEEGDRTVYGTAVTDQSGKTPVFTLETPSKALSQSAGADEKPYSTYNISVTADGFVEHISRNVPVFPDTLSVQTVDLMSISASGGNNSPQITDEGQKYEL